MAALPRAVLGSFALCSFIYAPVLRASWALYRVRKLERYADAKDPEGKLPTYLVVLQERGWEVLVRIKPTKNQARTLADVLYPCSIFGEGCLQLAASLWPEKYLDAVCLFMLPYKIASVVALLWYSDRIPGARTVALQWAVPAVLIVYMQRHRLEL